MKTITIQLNIDWEDYQDVTDELILEDALEIKKEGVSYKIIPEVEPKRKYQGNQTPIERLRNLLTPFITLAEVLRRNPSYDTKDLVNICDTYKKDISFYLSDCERFYTDSKFNGQTIDLLKEVVHLLNVKAHQGAKEKNWKYFQNGNGDDLEEDFNSVIKKSKKLLSLLKKHEIEK